jgi:hypothetical protein
MRLHELNDEEEADDPILLDIIQAQLRRGATIIAELPDTDFLEGRLMACSKLPGGSRLVMVSVLQPKLDPGWNDYIKKNTYFIHDVNLWKLTKRDDGTFHLLVKSSKWNSGSSS